MTARATSTWRRAGPRLTHLDVHHGKSGHGLGIDFAMQEGPVTLLNLTQFDAGDTFKLIYSVGEVIPGPVLNIGNPNCRVRVPAPDARVHGCVVPAGPVAPHRPRRGRPLDRARGVRRGHALPHRPHLKPNGLGPSRSRRGTMNELDSTTRVLNTFAGKPLDRLPVFDIIHNAEFIECVSGERLTPQNAEDLACRAVRQTLDLCRHFAIPDNLEPARRSTTRGSCTTSSGGPRGSHAGRSTTCRRRRTWSSATSRPSTSRSTGRSSATRPGSTSCSSGTGTTIPRR